VIIVNSLSAAKALFETKGANFSDRPSAHFACDIVGWKELPALQNMGPTLTEHRKRMVQAVGSKQGMENVEPTIVRATLACLKKMVEEPQRLGSHLRVYVAPFLITHLRTHGYPLRLNGSVILMISHGYEVKDADDKLLRLAEDVVADLARAVSPGAFLVDMIPARMFPPLTDLYYRYLLSIS
jgi:hypothetical protein